MVSQDLTDGKTHTFYVEYNHMRSAKQTIAVSGDATLTFQTTNVTIHYDCQVIYKPTGSWYTFTKPTIEMFPGSYLFRFAAFDSSAPYSGVETTIDVSGVSMEFNFILIQCEDDLRDYVPEASVAIYGVGTFPHGSVVDLDDGKTYQYRVVNHGIVSNKIYKKIDGTPIVAYLDKMQIIAQDDLGNPVPDAAAAAAAIYSVGTFKHGEYVTLPMSARIQYRVVNHGIVSNKLYKKIDGTDLVGYLQKMPIQAPYYKNEDVVSIYSVGTYQHDDYVTLPMGGRIQYRVLYEGTQSPKQYKKIDGTPLRATWPTLIKTMDDLGNPVPDASVSIYELQQRSHTAARWTWTSGGPTSTEW